MCYRFTHDKAYLKQGEGVANFMLSLPNMPDDGIPYWDMKAPEIKDHKDGVPMNTVPRDASAAAIMASALYELAGYIDSEESMRYRVAADKIVGNLSEHYQAESGSHYGFLLLHSTGHFPARSEVDVPLIYADYYYLEALARKEMSEKGHLCKSKRHRTKASTRCQ